MFGKDDKWLLASHLQKSIRRGMVGQAMWAAGHLHAVDRAYLAYRTGIILMEDLAGSGSNDLVDPKQPWGAKHFQSIKNEEDRGHWQNLIKSMAQGVKDNLACEYIHCVWWLKDFEQEEGPWEKIAPEYAIEQMHRQDRPWWWRGLMSWRGVGSKKYPHSLLPETEGLPQTWLEACPLPIQPLIQSIGFKQIEAHSVFLPLVFSRKNQLIQQPLSTETIGPWVACALDKHTREGSRALAEMYRQSPPEHKKMFDPQKAVDILGTLYFWVEGGKHDQFISGDEDQSVRADIRKRWLQHHGLHGRHLFDCWVDLSRLNTQRRKVIQNSIHSQTQGWTAENDTPKTNTI